MQMFRFASCFLTGNSDRQGLDDLRKFTYTELVKATDNFNNAKIIGEGEFGRVYRGSLRDNTEVTIMQPREGVYHDIDDFLQELKHSRRVNHANIVLLIGYCSQGIHKLLVYDFFPNYCLYKHLSGTHAGPGRLIWENRMKIAVGTANGLRYLHEDCNPKIILRNIKPSIILLDSNYQPKIMHLGLARDFPDEVSLVGTRVIGTVSLDPEYYWSMKRLTTKSDVYSFGIVILELIIGVAPWRWKSPQSTSLSLLRGLETDKFGRLVDPNLNEIYDRDGMKRMVICAAMCVHPSGKCRLDMSQVIKLLEEGSLQANDVAHIIAYTGSDPSQFNNKLELDALETLSTRLLEKEHPAAGSVELRLQL